MRGQGFCSSVGSGIFVKCKVLEVVLLFGLTAAVTATTQGTQTRVRISMVGSLVMISTMVTRDESRMTDIRNLQGMNEMLHTSTMTENRNLQGMNEMLHHVDVKALIIISMASMMVTMDEIRARDVPNMFLMNSMELHVDLQAHLILSSNMDAWIGWTLVSGVCIGMDLAMRKCVTSGRLDVVL